ncbi:MAG: sulfotransferase domain-containing protein [Candidatus Riflebacteria bacterium]|nr:sulfotransferase domain-containing protein [Candidatus Riflebacteria bacterium]
MKGIIWLASYMKSGNTWVRVFLENYRQNLSVPVSINSLEIPVASDRELLDNCLGIESSDFSNNEIDRFRSEMYLYLARQRKEKFFLKVHDCYSICEGPGEQKFMFPAEATYKAVYIIRNPFEVAISMSNYYDMDIDKTIEQMSNPDFTLAGDQNKLHSQLRQKIGTWSQHVESWIDLNSFPLLMVRYEDMKFDALNIFSGILDFTGFSIDRLRLEKSTRFSSFDELKKQETKDGFIENSSAVSLFFRKGASENWRSVLKSEQVNKIVHNHSRVMIRVGYLSASGEILC